MRLECERGKGGRPPYGGSSFDPSTLTRLCDIPRHFFWVLRSSRQDTAMLPISVHSSLLFDCLELKLGWIAWPVLRRGKRLVASLCCGPTHACMHLRHITCLIPESSEHLTNAASCCFTKVSAVFLSRIGGQIVAQTSSAEAVRVGSLSATAAERDRTCGRCTLRVIDE